MNAGREVPAGPPDLVVAGTDRDLAAWVAERPGALFDFSPSATSDLGRLVGLTGGPRPSAERARLSLTLDALRLGDGALCVNMVVVGTPPDRLHRLSRRTSLRVVVDGRLFFEARATSVVVATGEYLRGLDVVPRGHPGDGRAEVQVYRLRPAERRPMRARLPSGSHQPHPRILQRSGRRFEITSERPLPVEVDGVARPPLAALNVEVVPAAYRLIV